MGQHHESFKDQAIKHVNKHAKGDHQSRVRALLEAKNVNMQNLFNEFRTRVPIDVAAEAQSYITKDKEDIDLQVALVFEK